MLGLENPLHIAIVVLVVMMVFGAKRLPEMGRSLGSGLRGFKESITGEVATRTSAPAEELGGQAANGRPSQAPSREGRGRALASLRPWRAQAFASQASRFRPVDDERRGRRVHSSLCAGSTVTSTSIAAPGWRRA